MWEGIQGKGERRGFGFCVGGTGEEWLTLTGGDCVYIVISD